MRHRNNKATLNRPADQRKALVRSLITSLFLYGHVTTTDAKAKALQSEAEKLITLTKGKETEFNKIRELNRVIFTEESSIKALSYIAASQKTSGFTRATKVRFRAGDNALLMKVELIQE